MKIPGAPSISGEAASPRCCGACSCGVRPSSKAVETPRLSEIAHYWSRRFSSSLISGPMAATTSVGEVNVWTPPRTTWVYISSHVIG